MRRHTMAGLLALACASAWAQELPKRKPGLWEITLQTPGRTAVTVRQCTDQAHDTEVLLAMAPGQENCQAPKVRREQGRYHVETACEVHGTPVNTRFVLSGDLQSRYEGHHATLHHDTMRHPGQKPATSAQHVEGRWLSACPTGMQPGDMTLPNGITVNVLPQAHRGKHSHRHDAGTPH